MPKKITIDLPYETLDSITLEALKDTYENAYNSIDHLQSLEELKDFQKEDLKDSIEIRNAALRLIKYFSTPSEIEEYFGSDYNDQLKRPALTNFNDQQGLPTMPATLTKKSAFTGKPRTMLFPQYEQDEFERRMLVWKNKGMLIQDVFPELSNNEREFIISGATTEEWDEYLKNN